jgi:hypothetical protein
VLDLLDELDVKATFFWVGRNVEQAPELAREVVGRGHGIGSHSYRRTWWLTLAPSCVVRREVESTQRAIQHATAQISRLFRPPVGLTNPRLAPVLRRAGLTCVAWTIRSLDTRAEPSESVVRRVILPTYDNAETLESVLRGILERGIPMIVVNDGATDDTSAVLERVGDVDVICHAVNRGKGAAIRTGLDAAVGRGFTHAITMDTDGQHLAEDLPRIMAAIQESPDALIVGVRDLRGGGARLKSRMLRLNSNFWSWLETGVRTGDSQSGFRVYPLQIVKQLHMGTQPSDFEIEVLVKALWLGLPLRRVPIAVRYDTPSRSHFRPLRDFARVSWLNCRLMASRLLVPQPMREVLAQQAYHDQPRAER